MRGLTTKEEEELLKNLRNKAKKCAKIGSVMMVELVQLTEDFILAHNRDPTREKMSAWEIFKEKEKAQIEENNKQMKEWDKKMNMFGNENITEDTSTKPFSLENIQVEKEIQRQLDALEAAAQKSHHQVLVDKSENDEDLETEEDIDFDDDYSQYTSSRYNTDFIELGILGKGGGGEVMKVRNRLDRRLCKSSKLRHIIHIFVPRCY